MCKYVHWYGWGDGGTYDTLKEAKRELYKKRVEMRRIVGKRMLRDTPTVCEWMFDGKVHTVCIMRVPESACCPRGESLDPQTPYGVRIAWAREQLKAYNRVVGYIPPEV